MGFSFLVPSVLAIDWWNTNWENKQEVVINNLNDEINDYSLLLLVPYQEDMNPDFSDLRFVSDDNSELGYYFKNIVNSTSALVWVKVPVLKNESSTLIYIYYNNDVSTTSSFNSAFIYSDDFEQNTMNNYIARGIGCSSFLIENGTLVFGYANPSSGSCTISPKLELQFIDENYVVESLIKIDNDCGYSGSIGLLSNAFEYSIQGVTSWFHPNSDKFGISNRKVWKNSVSVGLSPNTYYQNAIIFNGKSDKIAVLDEKIYVSSNDNSVSKGFYGVVGYEGCGTIVKTTVEWFRVYPYANLLPTYEIGSVMEFNGTFPETEPGESTPAERLSLLEEIINGIIDDVLTLFSLNEQLETRIEILENHTHEESNEVVEIFPSYLNKLSSSYRKKIVCAYGEENHLTGIQGLGWNCGFTYKTYRSGRERVRCYCKRM